MSSRVNYIDGLGDEVAIAVVVITVIVALVIRCCFQYSNLREILCWLRLWRENAPHAVGQPLSSEGPQIVTRRHYDTDRCPICFQDFVLAVETNCGHMFCGSCLRQYFIVGNYLLRRMTCPICREQITIVLICFSEEEEAADNEALTSNRDNVREIVLQYNRNYSGEPRVVSDYFRDIPVLARHLWREFSNLGLVLRLRMMMFFIVGIIYLFVPIDLLPEAVFGVLGLLDDILFFIFIVVIVVNHYRNFVINRVIDYQ